MSTASSPPTAVVLISGRGSNLQAILDAIAAGTLSMGIAAVISNRPGAAGLDAAHQAGIPTHAVDHSTFPNREAFDHELARAIDAYRPDLVILAGFMRMLTGKFVNHYRGRLINIHPSLLPAYKGLNTHERALQDGAKQHGASIHFVTPDLDGGPVLMQVKVPVQPGDTAQELAERVLAAEHRLYPAALSLIASGRVEMGEHGLLLDGKPLREPLMLAGADADASK